MIRFIELGNNNEKTVTEESLQTLPLKGGWLEVVDPTETELHAVSDATSIPIGFLKLPKARDIVNLRFEESFTVVNFLAMENVISSKMAYPLVLAFSKDFLVTVVKKEIQPIINVAKERMSKTKIDPPSQVIYFIIDEVIASHYTHIEKLESLTSRIEEQVVEKTASETLKHIFKLKANMIRFNKVLWYERGLVFNLRKCGDNCMPAKIRSLFDTTHEDLTRQIDIVETYREILSDAINVHLSAVSNKINLSIQALTVVIFYLTIITTVTSFPNTVATFFGISQFGQTNVAIVVVALLLSMILPFVWLWRKRWLRFPTPEADNKIE
jgi:magnesium transporter